MTAKKIGTTETLDIVVYAFPVPFDIDLFTSHMLHRTAHMFMRKGEIESCFVAVSELDFETQRPPSTLSVIVPKRGHAATSIRADVREYLERSKAIAVASTSESDDRLTIVIEWKRHRSAFTAQKIEGLVLAPWQRALPGVAFPLLPVGRDDLQ